jgi:hypothetical protein
MTPIESSGNSSNWPKNVPGKPTQLAVFGIEQLPDGQLRYEVTFTGRFPDLERAMYWGAKRELEALRRGKFAVASRILWQHELTPEAAVAEMFADMAPQVRRALGAADVGFDPAAAMFDGPGPMRPVDYSKVEGIYVEAVEPASPKFMPSDPRIRPAGPAADGQ